MKAFLSILALSNLSVCFGQNPKFEIGHTHFKADMTTAESHRKFMPKYMTGLYWVMQRKGNFGWSSTIMGGRFRSKEMCLDCPDDGYGWSDGDVDYYHQFIDFSVCRLILYKFV